MEFLSLQQKDVNGTSPLKSRSVRRGGRIVSKEEASDFCDVRRDLDQDITSIGSGLGIEFVKIVVI